MVGPIDQRYFPVQDGLEREESMDEDDVSSGSPEQEQDFIPGLPNDLVLQHIATKVPWQAMYALTWVSQGWRWAIQSRKIYNLRKSSGLSQMMAVAPVNIDVQKAREGLPTESNLHQGFVDLDNQHLYVFPRPRSLPIASIFPHPNHREILQRAPLEACVLHKKPSLNHFGVYEAMVFMDGTLYALQEFRVYNAWEGTWKQNVFGLDVGACGRELRLYSPSYAYVPTDIWVACNGRIYSFQTSLKRIYGKVLDPENDYWTEIEDKPLNICYRADQLEHNYSHPRYYRDQVAVLGKEIYLGWNHVKDMMIFDCTTEKWRRIPNTLVPEVPGRNASSKRFSMTAIKDKLCNFFRSRVEIYNPESNSWTLSQRVCRGDYVNTVGMRLGCSGKEFINTVISGQYWSAFKDGFSKKFCKSWGLGAVEVTQIWENYVDYALQCNIYKDNLDLQLGYLEL